MPCADSLNAKAKQTVMQGGRADSARKPVQVAEVMGQVHLLVALVLQVKVTLEAEVLKLEVMELEAEAVKAALAEMVEMVFLVMAVQVLNGLAEV